MLDGQSVPLLEEKGAPVVVGKSGEVIEDTHPPGQLGLQTAPMTGPALHLAIDDRIEVDVEGATRVTVVQLESGEGMNPSLYRGRPAERVDRTGGGRQRIRLFATMAKPV